MVKSPPSSNPACPYSRAPEPASAKSLRPLEVSGHRAVREVLTGRDFHVPDMRGYLVELQRESGLDLGTLIAFAENNPFVMSGPKHIRYRRLAMDFLGRHRLESWLPVIDQAVEDGIDNLSRRTAPDLVRDFSEPLYFAISLRVLGLRPRDPDSFRANADKLLSSVEPYQSLRELLRIQEAIRDLLRQIMEQPPLPEAHSHPRPFLDGAQGDLSDEKEREEIAMLSLILHGGTLSSMHTLSAILWDILGTSPEIKRKAASEEWIEHNLERLIRRNSSTLFLYRFANAPRTIDGVAVQAGDGVALDLCSANRDPTADLADALALEKAENKKTSSDKDHLAFGAGLHSCLGASFARLTLSRVLPRLFSRLPNLTLGREEPEIRERALLKQIVRLPCTI